MNHTSCKVALILGVLTPAFANGTFANRKFNLSKDFKPTRWMNWLTVGFGFKRTEHPAYPRILENEENRLDNLWQCNFKKDLNTDKANDTLFKNQVFMCHKKSPTTTKVGSLVWGIGHKYAEIAKCIEDDRGILLKYIDLHTGIAKDDGIQYFTKIDETMFQDMDMEFNDLNEEAKACAEKLIAKRIKYLKKTIEEMQQKGDEWTGVLKDRRQELAELEEIVKIEESEEESVKCAAKVAGKVRWIEDYDGLTAVVIPAKAEEIESRVRRQRTPASTPTPTSRSSSSSSSERLVNSEASMNASQQI